MTIPKMAERAEAARLWEAERVADQAWDVAQEACDDDSEISRKYTRLREELDDQEDAELGLTEARRKAKAAAAAREAYPEEVRTCWDYSIHNNGIAKCAKSGVILQESDEVLRDAISGELFLRSALGLPSRPEEADDIEEAA